MNALLKYMRAHWFSMAFLVALLFFLMDMSLYVGSIGYKLYYPTLFVVAGYCLFRMKKINYIYLLFLLACLLSVLANEIPSYFHARQRWVIYVVLLICFSNFISSRRLALFRLHAFHISSILSTILVVVNYMLFLLGFSTAAQLERYEERGLYTGSTANNEMGILSAVAIMYLLVLLISFHQRMRLWEKLLILGGLACSISMMAMASSRMGLICTLISVCVVIYKFNQRSFLKLTLAFLFFVGSLFVVGSVFGSKFRFMLEKNGGQMERVDTHSRDEMWKSRMQEFRESPYYGIGFAYMKYGYGSEMAEKNQGRIESGSGWASVLSQTGLFGSFCLLFIVLPNLLFVLRRRNTSYCCAWYSGMCVIFVLQPITEAYITTVGAVLCCLFWLNYGVIESFRKGLLRESDLDLLRYSRRYRLRVQRRVIVSPPVEKKQPAEGEREK